MVTMLHQKKNSSALDFIIVGQGIAGSVLALSLIKSGFKVCIINQSTLSSSSQVAGGIWNPIVFKRLTKSWMADVLVPQLISFYEYWEKEFNITLIQKRSIIKPFTEEQEKNLWIKKANDHLDKNIFLDTVVYENLAIDDNHTITSYSKVLHAGNLDVNVFLKFTKTYLQEGESYIDGIFDFAKLHIDFEEVSYNNIKAKNIVFCEGYLISNNPYFNWIPMKPAKGETLTIKSKHIKLTRDIYNKGFFIMPLGNDLFKVGATYEWEEINDVPSEKAKQYLIEKLNSVLSSPYQIISHEAGVRPSVIDRRPVIGPHHTYKNVYVFNGLGTKAVMIAPYFAKQFVNSLLNNLEFSFEVNPSRFNKT